MDAVPVHVAARQLRTLALLTVAPGLLAAGAGLGAALLGSGSVAAVVGILGLASGALIAAAVWRAAASVERQLGAHDLERDLLTAEQDRLNRTLEGLTVRVAHDLRTPLSTVAMATQILTTEQSDLSDDGRLALRAVETSARHGLDLVSDLMYLAKASTTPRLEPVELADVAREAARDIRGLKVDVRVRMEVVADRVGLRHALANVFAYAAEHVPEGSDRAAAAPVQVHGVDAPDGWRIGIADRGAGLDEDAATTIFQPFAARAAGDGGAVGLGIAAAMADAHGGRAWHEARPGGGSIFWLLLPKHPLASLRMIGEPVSSSSAPRARTGRTGA